MIKDPVPDPFLTVMHRTGTIAGLIAIILTLAVFPTLAHAGPSTTSTEYQIKAVFLYHFASFVVWPSHRFADDSSPIVVGVLGEDPFGQMLDTVVDGETAQGRPLMVRRISDAPAARDCHIVFICGSEAAHVQEILDALGGSGALTVGDFEEFDRQGGMIRFEVVNRKVRFAVNLGVVEASGLTVSSKLLRLALNRDSLGG